MNKYELLADLIFPNINKDIEYLEKLYPIRNDTIVTRFAPSPTGYLHTGSLFTALISYKLAKDNNGIFYIRIEDTDTKREIEGSDQKLIEELSKFNIIPDEGFLKDKEVGMYGPYCQSDRKEIYEIVIKEMLKKNLCYPSFETEEELASLREYQEKNKINPGYYLEYATYRNKSVDELIELVKSKKKFIIRFRSSATSDLEKEEFIDLIRGKITITKNFHDIVILKSDGLPTYHFAHLVDDHFMRTTHVTRGEEWLSSLPIHLELFSSLNWKAPKYAHLPVILKIDTDNNRKRKLSKRKDKEASVSYFLENGYPTYSILEYLYTLTNSNYESWRENNIDKDFRDFKFSFDKMSLDGALFDMEKIDSISKDRISRKSADELLEEVKSWAYIYDKALYERINLDESFFRNILSIDKDKEKRRKDYSKYTDILPRIGFLYDDIYNNNVSSYGYEFEIDKKENIIKVLSTYINYLDLSLKEIDWFDSLRKFAISLGYSDNIKEFKKNPESYLGHVGNISDYIRISLSGMKNTPNLWYLQQILKKDKIIERINRAISYLNNL